VRAEGKSFWRWGAKGLGDPAPIAVATEDAHLATERSLFLTVFPSIMLPMFLAAVDQTIVATALPAIAGTLNDVGRVSWIVVAYLVATTISAPVYGRLGDSFVALSMFIGASLLSAAAPTVVLLSLGRLLQGLGGGGLMTLSQALIAESVPPRQRGRYQGYLSGMYAAAATFGPVAGGWLTEHFGWRSVFLVNLPLGLLAIALVLRLPVHGRPGGRAQFDLWGTVFFAGFICPLLLAMQRAQRFDPRVLPGVAILLAMAVTSLILLLRQERRAPAPLLPLNLFRQAGFWSADLLAACVAGQTVSLVSFLPMYLQIVRGVGATASGILLLPLTLGVAVGSLFAGRLIARTGRTAVFPATTLIISFAGLVALSFLAPSLTLDELPWLLTVIAACTGPAMPVVQMTVQTVAGPKFLGAAAASVQFSRSVGASFGTALTGAVLFALLAARDPTTTTMFADLLERGPHVLAALPQARRILVQTEIADAFRGAFATIACFSGSAMLLAWWLPVRRI